jgi:hypothetical protein
LWEGSAIGDRVAHYAWRLFDIVHGPYAVKQMSLQVLLPLPGPGVAQNALACMGSASREKQNWDCMGVLVQPEHLPAPITA